MNKTHCSSNNCSNSSNSQRRSHRSIVWCDNSLVRKNIQLPRAATRGALSDEAKSIESRKDAFNLFITPEMKNIMLKHTEQNILEKTFEKGKFDFKSITPDELDSFISILIYCGERQNTRTHFNELYTTSSFDKIHRYSATISRNRCKLILGSLRFDEKRTRSKRPQSDRFAAFHEFFNNVCIKHYNTGESLTVDERMVPFRVRVIFKNYNPSKPDKYRMKVFMLYDAENFYLKASDVYLGKVGDSVEREQGKRVVLQLTNCLGPGYNVTTDNFFTSLSLSHELLTR